MKGTIKIALMLLMLAALTVDATAQKRATLIGNIFGTRNLAADTVYSVSGFVRIQPGAVLNIPAGTRLEGIPDTLSNFTNVPVLETVRGDGTNPSGQIVANGTKTAPIVFTSIRANLDSVNAGKPPKRGDIGGFVLNGNALNNVAGGTRLGEGNAGPGGGNIPADNSGVLRYVRVEFAGIKVTTNSELNGFTFNSVGSGTTLEYLQSHMGNDDGFEWFGGTVNAKYLVSSGNDDDNIDTDNSFRGKIQFVLIVQDSVVANRAYESDNDEPGSSLVANGGFTRPAIYNSTIIGTGKTQANNERNDAIYVRRNSSYAAYNQVVANFGGYGFVVDKATSGAQDNFLVGTVADSGIVLQNSLFFVKSRTGTNGAPAWYTFTSSGIPDSAGMGALLATNKAGDPQFVSVNYINPMNNVAPDLRVAVGSPALTGWVTPPNDGFYDTTAKYMGAFGDATSPNWAEGWTNWEKTYTPTLSVVKEQYSPVATNFALTQNYPNPFNPTTNITYTLQKPETVSLKVYDVLGREVETLVQSRKAAGTYTVTFNASKLTSGVYFYRLNAGGFVSSKKMMLVK